MDREKEQRAIQYLRTFEPESEPYYLCYSGGKDSDCIRILAELAGVKHECKHNLTTVDAPETVHYVWETIGKENVCYPELSMWQLIVKKKMPPTRLARYCCEELKERGGKGRVKVTDVRWAESANRRKNGGFVKIIGKPKTVQKLAEDKGINFRLSDKGGADTKRRQLGGEEICRTLLPNDLNNGKSDSGLDGRRCMGVSSFLRLPVKPIISMRTEEDRVYRLPFAKFQGNERRF